MTRSDLVDQCKAIIREAYDEAAEMIVAYLELHPGEALQTLCKEIEPDNWNALRAKVQRAQGARKSASGASPARAQSVRRLRQRIQDADNEQLADAIRVLPAEKRAALVRAAVPPPEKIERTRTGPTFVELVVRISSALIELEGMVAGWGNLAAVPDEFSRDSFGDIVAKALRIQDRFDALGQAIDNDDEDEFLNIVRNFRVIDDVR